MAQKFTELFVQVGKNTMVYTLLALSARIAHWVNTGPNTDKLDSNTFVEKHTVAISSNEKSVFPEGSGAIASNLNIR